MGSYVNSLDKIFHKKNRHGETIFVKQNLICEKWLMTLKKIHIDTLLQWWQEEKIITCKDFNFRSVCQGKIQSQLKVRFV